MKVLQLNGLNQMEIKLNTKPYKEQLEIIKECTTDLPTDRIKWVVVSTGRQVGKTSVGVLITLDWAFNNPDSNILVILPTYKQIRKVFRQYLKIFRTLKNIKTNKSELSIDFPNGSLISFCSGESKDSVRGNSINYLWVDEAAFIKDIVFEDAISPLIIAVGRVALLTSTPKGQGNYFHKSFMADYTKSITFASDKSPLISKIDLDNAKKTLPYDIYRQEYLAEFLEGSGTIFKNIKECAKVTKWEEPVQGMRYFAGIDWGKKKDSSVLTIMDINGRVVFIMKINGTNYTNITTMYADILKKYKALTWAETNGIGDVVYEMLELKYNFLFPFITSNKSKDNIIVRTSNDFTDNAIEIPTEQLFPALTRELIVFTFTFNPVTKVIKYSAPEGFHDDTVMSLCICNEARHQNKIKGTVETYKDVYDESRGMY